MPGTVATDELELIETGGGSGSPPHADGGDGHDSFGRPAVPQRAYVTGMTMALAGIVMFFMALTSSYIVRKGLGGDWQAVALPRLLWLNTLVLLASSATLVSARRRLALEDAAGFRHWWGVTTALGLLFLAGQLLAWRQLAAEGLYLASNAASSFFYLLTAAHGVHLLGGIVALLFVGFRSRPGSRIARTTATELAAIYWHFMDGLWVFLLLLLYLGR